MKDFLDRHGVGVVVFALFIIGILMAGWIDGCKNESSKTVVTVDSTTYYKNLYQQGKLNYEFHSKLKYHETQLQQIQTDLKHENKHIDGLRGANLQREVDRQFNRDAENRSDRQPQTAPASSRQAHPANGGRGAGSPPVQSRSTSEPGHNCPEGLDSNDAIGYDFSAEFDYPADEQARPGRPATIGKVSAGYTNGKEKAVPFTARKLGVERPDPVRFVLESKESVSRNNFRRMILKQQYTYPRVALAISSVETGRWGPGTEIIRQRNLFAMKSNARGNYIGLRYGYAVFATYQASLDDYGQYEQGVIRKYGLNSEKKYIDHICKRFCPHPDYRSKLMGTLDGSGS